MLHIRDLQKDTDIQVKNSIKEEICVMTVPNQYHYFEYFISKEFDRIDNIQIGINGNNLIDAIPELLVDDEYSCEVNKELILIICSTHSQFKIKIYFKAEFQTDLRIYIKYDSYEFLSEFKEELMMIPFQTDTHMYVDNKVETI